MTTIIAWHNNPVQILEAIPVGADLNPVLDRLELAYGDDADLDPQWEQRVLRELAAAEVVEVAS